jgi:hypothetical protein
VTGRRTVTIEVGEAARGFTLDFDDMRWEAADPGGARLPEGDFPLVAEVEGERFELYSDGTFARVERTPEA